MDESPHGLQRVAFFGGSFDPPHQGHLAVARAALEALSLDTVLFAPVGSQPLKPLGSTASFEDRLAMTSLAIAPEPRFALSLVDAPKPSAGPNYTIDTLLELRAERPTGSKLFCLMGADSFFGLRRWYRAAEIPFVAPLIVASRPGQPLDDLRDALPEGLTMEPAPETTQASSDSLRATFDLRTYTLCNFAMDTVPLYILAGLHIEISASQVREQIQGSAAASAVKSCLLAPSVLSYILSHELYR